MNITRLSTPVRSLFCPSSINQLARDSGFVSRLRGLQRSCLLAALFHVLGTKGDTSIADIHRQLMSLSPSAPASLPFRHIHVHDGSTLKLHDGLKNTFAGRSAHTMPGAVELHLTVNLLIGSVDYLGIDADKESERLYQPYANESAQVLQLMNAGYFDITYISDIKNTMVTVLCELKAISIPLFCQPAIPTGSASMPWQANRLNHLSFLRVK